MINEPKNQETSPTEGDASSRAKHWYRQVAGATALAGAALGGAEEAAAGIVVHTSGETVGARVITSPGWQLQTLYFDFYSGKTLMSPILDTWVKTTRRPTATAFPPRRCCPRAFSLAWPASVRSMHCSVWRPRTWRRKTTRR